MFCVDCLLHAHWSCMVNAGLRIARARAVSGSRSRSKMKRRRKMKRIAELRKGAADDEALAAALSNIASVKERKADLIS